MRRKVKIPATLTRHPELVSGSIARLGTVHARERNPCVYILASQPRGTLYIGVTSDLIARLYQHRESTLPGFTKRHVVKRLVWYEMHETMEAAILREKQLKNWHRPWKLNLIDQANPHWADLAVGLGFAPLAPRGR